ncbi:hypothetical protein [Erythrobacter sp. JK5]|uniref:hypothetical protein n=1 Tax=Erythrobacter sp. JK5 TaxID=2829500 RepID=UPI001BAD9117|nr:hypothetical protein [Erythrobacter sp. JK5]QUL37458.1 hypothetical protein KDC96_14045 [Erythrobacter sp. JK5]
MSSNAAPVFRSYAVCLSVCGAVLLSSPARAQDEAATVASADAAEGAAEESSPPRASPPINILITVPRGEVNEAQAQECEDREDAATISGDIVVCRRLGDSGENSYSGSRTEAQKRYAEETAFAGDIRAPDVAGGGIFRGPATISGQCLIPPCPPPPALLIDVEALPEAPEGSDADRIARGLPPLGQDENLTEDEIRKRREALGLPPPRFEQPPE